MLSPEKYYHTREESETSETEHDESFSSASVPIENVLQPAKWDEEEIDFQKKTPLTGKSTFCLKFKNDSTFSVIKKSKSVTPTKNNGEQETLRRLSCDGKSKKNEKGPFNYNYFVYSITDTKGDDETDKQNIADANEEDKEEELKASSSINNTEMLLNTSNVANYDDGGDVNDEDDLENNHSTPNLLMAAMDSKEKFIRELETELGQEQENDISKNKTTKKSKSVKISADVLKKAKRVLSRNKLKKEKKLSKPSSTKVADKEENDKEDIGKEYEDQEESDEEQPLDKVCLGVDKCFQLVRDGKNKQRIVTRKVNDEEADNFLHSTDSIILTKKKSKRIRAETEMDEEDEDNDYDDDDDDSKTGDNEDTEENANKNKVRKEQQSKTSKKKPKEVCKCPPEEVFQRLLTQQEFFNNLLKNYEKENKIAEKLSRDFLEKDKLEVTEEEKEEVQAVVDLTSKSDKKLNKAKVSDRKTSVSSLPSSIFSGSELHISKGYEIQGVSVSVAEIGKCFQRGFRENNVALSGDRCFLIEEKDEEKYIEAQQSFIDFSEKESPLEYLLALGFSVDEASNALKDEDISNRVNAAIIEARVWVNTISTDKGTLLYLLAYKAKPIIMRYYLHLVEAIVNGRITDAVKLDGFLNLLQKIEEGKIDIFVALGIQEYEDEETESKLVKQQVRQVFLLVHKVAEEEAFMRGQTLTHESKRLLITLSTRYRAGLVPHLEMIARYIGKGLLVSDVQLEAAMIYLSRLNTPDVNTEEFEHYCAFKKPPT